MMQRAIELLPGVSMIGILAAGAVAAGVGLLEVEGSDASWVDGGWTDAVEDEIDSHFALRSVGVTAWGVAEYALFGNGRDGVIVGDDGWLYSSEELRSYPDEADEIARKLALVEAVRDRLEEQGATLVVALVPSKARVHPEHLGRYVVPAQADGRYAAFHAALSARGIPAPDLAAAMAGSAEPLFMKTDTHWSPAGARVAAEAIGASVGRDLAKTAFDVRAGEPVLHTGDLLEFIPLGPLQERLGPPAEQVVPWSAVPRESAAAALLGDIETPVALVGTSYSAGDLWSFPDALAVALGARVLDASIEGKGPVAPMHAYLQDEAFLEDPPDVVVWEIPERYLPVAYDDALYEVPDGRAVAAQ